MVIYNLIKVKAKVKVSFNYQLKQDEREKLILFKQYHFMKIWIEFHHLNPNQILQSTWPQPSSSGLQPNSIQPLKQA